MISCLQFYTGGDLFSCLAGGTLALYSLLCRHAKISTIPNQHKTDEDLTTYSRQTYEENSLAAKIKRWLETRAYKRNCLLILVLLGTCTAIGDGILTPAISGILHNLYRIHVQHHIFLSKLNISRNLICDLYFTVLSASGGIKVQNPNMSTGNIVFSISYVPLPLYFIFCIIPCCKVASSLIFFASGRYCCTCCRDHLDWSIQHATLWYRQSWMAICTYSAHLVHFNWKRRCTEHTQAW